MDNNTISMDLITKKANVVIDSNKKLNKTLVKKHSIVDNFVSPFIVAKWTLTKI